MVKRGKSKNKKKQKKHVKFTLDEIKRYHGEKVAQQVREYHVNNGIRKINDLLCLVFNNKDSIAKFNNRCGRKKRIEGT